MREAGGQLRVFPRKILKALNVTYQMH